MIAAAEVYAPKLLNISTTPHQDIWMNINESKGRGLRIAKPKVELPNVILAHQRWRLFAAEPRPRSPET